MVLTLDLGHGVIVPPECCELVKAPVEKLPNIFPVKSPKLSPNPAYLIHSIRVAMDLNFLPEFASNNLASRGILENHTLPIRKKIGDFVIRCLDLLPGEIFPFDYHSSGQRSSGDEKIKSKSDHSKSADIY